MPPRPRPRPSRPQLPQLQQRRPRLLVPIVRAEGVGLRGLANLARGSGGLRCGGGAQPTRSGVDLEEVAGEGGGGWLGPSGPSALRGGLQASSHIREGRGQGEAKQGLVEGATCHRSPIGLADVRGYSSRPIGRSSRQGGIRERLVVWLWE